MQSVIETSVKHTVDNLASIWITQMAMRPAPVPDLVTGGGGCLSPGRGGGTVTCRHGFNQFKLAKASTGSTPRLAIQELDNPTYLDGNSVTMATASRSILDTIRVVPIWTAERSEHQSFLQLDLEGGHRLGF